MDETDRVVQLERRNAELQRELADVQDKLSSSRAERDDIGIKYSALTDRLDRMMRPGDDNLTYDAAPSRSATSGRPDAGRATAIDTIGRGRRLEEENQAFRRRLETYQESQRQQAQVVAQLQDKVQQYKQRCAQLEDRMADSGRRLAAADQRTQERLQTAADRDHALDLETALVRLEEAENRCVTLSDVNALLREQLDAAQEANEALTGEIQKLTADWQRLRDEMEHKELDWKEEEQTFNDYYNAEHARMLKLWKEIVGFRRDFSDLKLGTERDLSRVRSEMARLARQTADACSTVNVTGSGPEQTSPAAGGAASAPAVRKQVSQMSAAFSNAGMWEKMQDIQKQEATFRVKKREMETKIKDLSNQLDMSRSEVVEKEKMVVSLNKMVHTLETSAAELSQKLEASRLVSEENDVLSQAIREVAQLVVDDSERGPETDDKVTVLVKSTSLARDVKNILQHAESKAEKLQETSALAKSSDGMPTPIPRQETGQVPTQSQAPAHPPIAPRGYMTGLAWRSPQNLSASSVATPASPACPSTPHCPPSRGNGPASDHTGYMEGLAWQAPRDTGGACSVATPSSPLAPSTPHHQDTQRTGPVPYDTGYMEGLAWQAPQGTGRALSVGTPSSPIAPSTPNTPSNRCTGQGSSQTGYMEGLAWQVPRDTGAAYSVATPSSPVAPSTPIVQDVTETEPASSDAGYMEGLAWRFPQDKGTAFSVATPSSPFVPSTPLTPSTRGTVQGSDHTGYMEGIAWHAPQQTGEPFSVATPSTPCTSIGHPPRSVNDVEYMAGLACRSPQESASVASLPTPSASNTASNLPSPSTKGVYPDSKPAGYMEGLAWRSSQGASSSFSVATSATSSTPATPLPKAAQGSSPNESGYMTGLAWRAQQASSVATPSSPTASSTPVPPSTPGIRQTSDSIGYMDGLAWRAPDDARSNFSIATPSSPSEPTASLPRSTQGAPVVPNTGGYATGARRSPQGSGSVSSLDAHQSPMASTSPSIEVGYMSGLAWRSPKDSFSASSIDTPCNSVRSATQPRKLTQGIVAASTDAGYMTGLAWRSPQDSTSVSSLVTPSRSSERAIPFCPHSLHPSPLVGAPAPGTEGYMTGLAWCAHSSMSGTGYMAGPEIPGSELHQAAPSVQAPTTQYMAGLAWRPAPTPDAPPWEVATPASGQDTPMRFDGTPYSGDVPVATQRTIFDAPVGSSTATPLSGGATPSHGADTPRTSADSPRPGVTDTLGLGHSAGDSDTPPWEVATPGSGSSTPVAPGGSVLSGLILPPFGLPSLNAPSWPTPGSEMESGVGAGPGSEPQPLSRPSTARRSRPQLEPEPEPKTEPEPEPDPESDPEPSEAVENPEESAPPGPTTEETSPDAEQGMEVAKAPPPKGKGGCCSLS